jgi:hypothetical protein
MTRAASIWPSRQVPVDDNPMLDTPTAQTEEDRMKTANPPKAPEADAKRIEVSA